MFHPIAGAILFISGAVLRAAYKQKPTGSGGGIKSKTAILAIGTSHFGCVAQSLDEACQGIERAFRGKMSDSYVDFFTRTLLASTTKTRYTAAFRNDWSEENLKTKTGLYAGAKDYFSPTTEERNAVYKTRAPPMAIDAARKAIASWGGDKQRITHTVFHSCTGVTQPGIDIQIVDALQLENVKRRAITFMGCYGGLNALSIAKAFCESDPEAVCLLVCVEVSTTQLSLSSKRSFMVGNSIFADGAAAAVIGQGNNGDWAIANSDMLILGKETRNSMVWDLTKGGESMYLDKNIGKYFYAALKPKLDGLVRKLTGHRTRDVYFCVHPGGKGVLLALEHAGISRSQLSHSWDTLANHGNMSSPTILFVLKAAMEDPLIENDKMFCFAFGSGLTVESLALEKISATKVASENTMCHAVSNHSVKHSFGHLDGRTIVHA